MSSACGLGIISVRLNIYQWLKSISLQRQTFGRAHASGFRCKTKHLTAVAKTWKSWSRARIIKHICSEPISNAKGTDVAIN